MRYAAPAGLRSLVEDLAATARPGVPRPRSTWSSTTRRPASCASTAREAAAVALCMPGPQALDLLPDHLADERAAADRTWEPALALVAHWPTRAWPALDGAFVNESPVLTFVADDGRRRGDGAPVLVAHSDPVLAAAHLDDPLRRGPGDARRAARRPGDRRGPGRLGRPPLVARQAAGQPGRAVPPGRGRHRAAPATAGTARAGSRRRTCPGWPSARRSPRGSPGSLCPAADQPLGACRAHRRARRRLEGDRMPAIVLIGAQWGDEGKGKATDLLGGRRRLRRAASTAATTPGTPSSSAARSTRCTCCPPASSRPTCTPVIGNGVVIDLAVLFDEIDGLAVARGRLLAPGGQRQRARDPAATTARSTR